MKPLKTLSIPAFALLWTLGQVSCHKGPQKPEAEKLVDSFKAKVEADLLSHKSRKDVWPQTETKYEEAGWYLVQVEAPDTFSMNVEKTDSIVSPYLGTAEFPVTGNVSYPKNSKEEALEATEFKSSYAIKHKLTYAYQSGEWVFKSEQCYDYDVIAEGHIWRNCFLKEHGAHLPIMSTP